MTPNRVVRREVDVRTLYDSKVKVDSATRKGV